MLGWWPTPRSGDRSRSSSPGPRPRADGRGGGPGLSGSPALRVGLIDVDGLLFNQNLTGLYSVGENPVASFREKLEAAAADPRVHAVVVRINSPGGGVTASDIMADELRRFREESGKPVVCCLMDVATAGAYYLAVGGDEVVALPTSLTGAIGALINHYNLQDAMAQLNLTADPVKAGPMVDMGSVTRRSTTRLVNSSRNWSTASAIGSAIGSRSGGPE